MVDRRPRARLVAVAIAIAIAVVLGLLVALLTALQRSLIYFPSAGPVPPAGAVLPGARDVVLTTEHGLRLGAWWVPGRGGGGNAVLVANGNAGHRGMRAPLARALARAGLAVLRFDYRGFGWNPGSPSE